MRDCVEGFFDPLITAIEALSQRMQPAPVMRDAAAARELVYQPCRRAIEPVDLPIFSPLFCTAIEAANGAIEISGLKPDTAYKISLWPVKDLDRGGEETLHSSPQGQVRIDITAWIQRLQDQDTAPVEMVWFLAEDRPGAQTSNGWSSGLVWLESNSTLQLSQEIQSILFQAAQEDMDESDINTLVEINLLAAREHYIKAYERARRALLHSSKQSKYESRVPFRECLWQLIHYILENIETRIETRRPRLPPNQTKLGRAYPPCKNFKNESRSGSEGILVPVQGPNTLISPKLFNPLL